MAVEGELCRAAPRRSSFPRRTVLQIGLALLATGAFGDLVWSVVRAPRWVAGLDATYAALLGLVLTGLARTFRSMQAYRDRTARAQALVRSYVPAPVAEGILDADRAADIALHRRTLSILFADLQSFAELTESLEPDALTLTLETYFAAVAGAVEKHGGSIHKYLGDGVMVLFGLERAPARADHGLRAVRAARAIQEAVGTLTARGSPAGNLPSSGPGRLRRAGRTVEYQRTYVLEDAQGLPIVYAAPEPGLDLEPYLNQNVELFGHAAYRGEIRAYYMTVSRVQPLP